MFRYGTRSNEITRKSGTKDKLQGFPAPAPPRSTYQSTEDAIQNMCGMVIGKQTVWKSSIYLGMWINVGCNSSGLQFKINYAMARELEKLRAQITNA
ncbi:hypothetical protein Tco_0692336 [Tanacetum coccineum]